MISKKLSCDAISMTIRYNYNDLSRIYNKYKEMGLLYMQYINIYLCKYGGRVGYISDLNTIVPQDIRNEFDNFKEWLKKSGELVYMSGKYFYLPLRNKVLGFSVVPTENDISYMKLLHGKGDYKCPFSLSDIKKFISNVVNEINTPLPEYAANTEKIMLAKHSNKDLDTYFRLTSYYLRHSTCMIGVISDKDITAKIINLKGLYLSYFIKDNPYMYIDYENMIFCDRQQRLLHGFTELPLESEISKVKSNFRMRVNFMKNKNF